MNLKKRPKFDSISIGNETRDLHASIRIGIVNTGLNPDHIKASYRRAPVTTRDRLKKLSIILNYASSYSAKNPDKEKINLLIFPEVSIPYAWATLCIGWARKHNIGLICGLEHRVSKAGIAVNEYLAALPYKNKYGNTVCMPIRRIKRYYSPGERHSLDGNSLTIPKECLHNHQIIKWRGATFSIFNCFELASIEDRSILKGRVDFLVAIEANHDINYFSNIVESSARDLHCYVVQANDSIYGDSRIVAPAPNERMNIMRIKGGENDVIMVESLNLSALREFQRLKYSLQKDIKQFKVTPPNFMLEDVMGRIGEKIE